MSFSLNQCYGIFIYTMRNFFFDWNCFSGERFGPLASCWKIVWIYSETCLIWNALGEKFCVGIDKMSETHRRHENQCWMSQGNGLHNCQIRQVLLYFSNYQLIKEACINQNNSETYRMTSRSWEQIQLTNYLCILTSLVQPLMKFYLV